MRKPRIALIGARRVRQGLGPFVARHLVELGAEVPCFLGTRPETIAESERALGARGYGDLSELISEEAPDALAILSPSETHERYLEAALEAGVHVLCDKPLLWNGPGLARRASRLVERFAAASLLLRENCQWPYTLAAYRSLHPDTGPPASFAMRLSPSLAGAAADAGGRALASAQPAPGADRCRRTRARRSSRSRHGRARSCCASPIAWRRLRWRARSPCARAIGSRARPAYAVNGRWAERRIRPSDYAFTFTDGEREVPAPDPLRELLRDSLAALPTRGASVPPDPAIPARMALLEQILEALPVARG